MKPWKSSSLELDLDQIFATRNLEDVHEWIVDVMGHEEDIIWDLVETIRLVDNS